MMQSDCRVLLRSLRLGLQLSSAPNKEAAAAIVSLLGLSYNCLPGLLGLSNVCLLGVSNVCLRGVKDAEVSNDAFECLGVGDDNLENAVPPATFTHCRGEPSIRGTWLE
jgi:hypothetical protein